MAKNYSEGDSGSMAGYAKNFFDQPGNKPTKPIKGSKPKATTLPQDKSTKAGRSKVNKYGKKLTGSALKVPK